MLMASRVGLKRVADAGSWHQCKRLHGELRGMSLADPAHLPNKLQTYRELVEVEMGCWC